MSLQNVTLYKEAAATAQELIKNVHETGKLVQIFHMILRPFDAGVNRVSFFLADKIIEHFPISCPESLTDPVSTEQVIQIVQLVKRVSGKNVLRQPLNVRVLQYADTCGIGVTRIIYLFAKDCELILHIPDGLRMAVDKVCLAVQQEIIVPIVRDAVEMGRQMVQEVSHPAIEQAAPPPPAIKAAPRPTEALPQQALYLSILVRRQVSVPASTESAPASAAAAPKTNGWFSGIRSIGSSVASRFSTGLLASYNAGKFVVSGVATGVTKVVKVGAGFAVAGVATMGGYWASKKLSEIQQIATKVITEKEREARKKVVALAAAKARNFVLPKLIRGVILMGAGLIGRSVIAHDKNSQIQMALDIAGYAAITFSAIGTALWVRSLVPTAKAFHRQGSAPFDPNVSTVEELVGEMVKTHGDKILPIIQFVRSKNGERKAPVYITNFTQRVVRELQDIPAVQLAFPSISVPPLLEAPPEVALLPAPSGPVIEELNEEEPLLLEDPPEESLEQQLVAIHRERNVSPGA